MFIKRKYPSTRLRRLRKNSNLIDLVSETNLSSSDLIQPIFIKENFNGKEDIKSMPGIFRFGIEDVLKEIEDIINSGINSIAVFPVIESSKKELLIDFKRILSSKYHIPKEILFIEKFIRTSSNKINRRKTIEHYKIS